jgi:serine/threonine-protein kinase
LLVDQGRVAEARVQLQLCDDLDPGFPIVKALLGRCFFVERNYGEAIVAYGHALSVAQNYSQAYLQIAQAEEARNGMEAAIDARQQAAIIDGVDTERVSKECSALRKAFREGGESGYWGERLAQAKRNRKPEDENYEIATIYVRLGEKEEALDWLDKAYSQRDRRLRRLIVDQCWDGLRGELRFQRLLRKVGFVSEYDPRDR